MSETLNKPFIKENESPKLEKPFIKLSESEKRTEIAKRKNPEEKRYIIMIRSDIDEINQTWLEAEGRTEAYNLAKTLAVGGDINISGPDASFVLVEGNTLENSVSLYWFIKGMQNIFNDGFNIDDYTESIAEEKEEPINPSVEAGNKQVDVTYNPSADEGIDV